MARELPEWIGKSDNAQIPPKVRVRVFLRFLGICQECGVKIVGKRWICDHRNSLINGGENRESNLGPIHETCDKTKTKADVAEKAKIYRKVAKAIGVRVRQSRPIMGSRASGYKRHFDGRVTKR